MKAWGACALLAVACVSPSRARFLGGYVSLEDASGIDGACRARVANAALEPAPQIVVPPPPPPPSAVNGGPSEGTATAAGGASYVVDGGPLGQLRVDVHGALGIGGGVEVSPPVSYARLAARPPVPVRGFLYGVDLRVYRKIVFVIDASGQMCAAGSMGTRPPIDDATDQVIAAISGLPRETEFLMMSTAASVHTLAPGPGDDGRRAAMQWTCNLLCIGDMSLSVALLDAFAEKPDVVVVVSTNGGSYLAGQDEGMLDRDLQLGFTDPAKVLERVANVVPVIAVDLGRGSGHLAAIAQRTGGVVVRP